MGIYQGRLALTRYRLLGSDKPLKIAKLNEYLEPFKAKPLRLTTPASKPLSFGWVPAAIHSDTLAAAGEAWDLSHCRVNNGLLLRCRVDKRKIPGSLVQLLARQEIEKVTARRSKPLKRAERQQIIADLKLDLLSKVLPQVSFFDAFWRDSDREILLFSTRQQTRTVFDELFRKSFAEPLGLSMVMVEPPLLGLDEAAWIAKTDAKDLMEQLTLTVPTPFIPTAHETVLIER